MGYIAEGSKQLFALCFIYLRSKGLLQAGDGIHGLLILGRHLAGSLISLWR